MHGFWEIHGVWGASGVWGVIARVWGLPEVWKYTRYKIQDNLINLVRKLHGLPYNEKILLSTFFTLLSSSNVWSYLYLLNRRCTSTSVCTSSVHRHRQRKRMYLRWSLCTLYLHACRVRVTVGDSGLLYLCYVFRKLINSLVC